MMEILSFKGILLVIYIGTSNNCQSTLNTKPTKSLKSISNIPQTLHLKAKNTSSEDQTSNQAAYPTFLPLLKQTRKNHATNSPLLTNIPNTFSQHH